MDAEELAQLKEEYYAALSEHPSLHEILNQKGGLILARVGSHPPWPARFSEPGEFAKMSKYRTKRGQLCVYFFGTRNYGWVSRTQITPFSTDLSGLKTSKKYTPAMTQRALNALAEAQIVLDDTDEYNTRFYDRIIERRDEPVDMPCELCNRVDDHFSLLILCDGQRCKREFHMNCLNPPLLRVPPGDWFCPDCLAKLARSDRIDDRSGRVHIQDDESSHSPSGDGPKRSKKLKLKGKDATLKRKLPSTSDDVIVNRLEVSPATAKKSRGQNRIPESSPRHSSRPSTPVQDGPGFLGGKKSSGAEGPTVDSEERCLICGYGGELVVCEFTGCTKVYHQFCLGSFPFPKDEDATWFCPRHTCARSGDVEYVDEGDPFSAKSPRRTIVRKQLWKCTSCPLALSEKYLAAIPKAHITSKTNKTFTCVYCTNGAPLKVQLAKFLERIWSIIATNRQGMPFCGPVLPGIDSTSVPLHSRKFGLFQVLAKIRRLEYANSSYFEADIKRVMNDALTLLNGGPIPMVEAARTLAIICEEHLTIQRERLDILEGKISGLLQQNKDERLLEEGTVGVDKKKWPLRWRQECGSFDDRYYPEIESRSLAEWTAYITAAPMYAICDDDEEPVMDPVHHPRIEPGDYETEHGGGSLRKGALMDSDSDGETSAVAPSFPGLTLSEGTDVMIALSELAQWAPARSGRVGGWQERELEESDGREFFLSPSISEMQQLFDQQSAVLRQALESHSALQKAWIVSKQKLLGLGDGIGFSIGEGRLAAELRIANKNLRARLRNKDKLVDQLTADQASLRAELRTLQAELELLKDTSSQAADSKAQSQHPADVELVDEEDTSGAESRRSPRAVSKNGDPIAKGRSTNRLASSKQVKKPRSTKSVGT